MADRAEVRPDGVTIPRDCRVVFVSIRKKAPMRQRLQQAAMVARKSPANEGPSCCLPVQKVATTALRARNTRWSGEASIMKRFARRGRFTASLGKLASPHVSARYATATGLNVSGSDAMPGASSSPGTTQPFRQIDTHSNSITA